MTYIAPTATVLEESGRADEDILGKVDGWRGIGWLKMKCL